MAGSLLSKVRELLLGKSQSGRGVAATPPPMPVRRTPPLVPRVAKVRRDTDEIRLEASKSTIRRLIQSGTELGDPLLFDLVAVQGPKDGCEICTKHMATIYSISGNTPGHEKLRDIPPFHQKCRCWLIGHVDLISPEAVAARKESNQALFQQWQAKGRPGAK